MEHVDGDASNKAYRSLCVDFWHECTDPLARVLRLGFDVLEHEGNRHRIGPVAEQRCWIIYFVMIVDNLEVG
jgi:hypothetical protein